jgi:hypothetical protein
MSNAYDRAHARHYDLMKQRERLQTKQEDLLDSLMRTHAKLIQADRALARSRKHLDKIEHDPRYAKAHLKKPAPDLGKLTPEQADKVIAAEPLPVYDLEPKPAKPKASPRAADLPAKEKRALSNLNQQLNEAFFGKPKARKQRRTPDDFRAEMAAKKKAAGDEPAA